MVTDVCLIRGDVQDAQVMQLLVVVHAGEAKEDFFWFSSRNNYLGKEATSNLTK